MENGKIDVLLGLQWGDEGKGKVVDVLTPRYDVVARFQGGPNAGHTLEFEGQKYVLRSIPSGIFQGGKVNFIGNKVCDYLRQKPRVAVAVVVKNVDFNAVLFFGFFNAGFNVVNNLV